MNINLLESRVIGSLLSCKSNHAEFSSSDINCCPIGEAFFAVEKLKKNGHEMSTIGSGNSEFQIAVNQKRVFVAPLDSSALQNGLFDSNDDGVRLHSDATNPELHPYESMILITLRDFDLIFNTNFLDTRYAV